MPKIAKKLKRQETVSRNGGDSGTRGGGGSAGAVTAGDEGSCANGGIAVAEKIVVRAEQEVARLTTLIADLADRSKRLNERAIALG